MTWLTSSDFLVPNWGCDSCAGDPSKFYSTDNSTTSAIISCHDPHYQCSKCSNRDQCIYTVSFVGKTYRLSSYSQESARLCCWRAITFKLEERQSRRLFLARSLIFKCLGFTREAGCSLRYRWAESEMTFILRAYGASGIPPFPPAGPKPYLIQWRMYGRFLKNLYSRLLGTKTS